MNYCLGTQILAQALLGDIIIIRTTYRNYEISFAKPELGRQSMFPK